MKYEIYFISFHDFSEIDFYRGRGQKARAEGARAKIWAPQARSATD